MSSPRKPPLPTPEEVRNQWDPGIDSVTNLIARIRPRRFDGALCAGKAPLFDLKKFTDETDAEYRDRKTYIRHHCHACPVVNCPQELK